LGQFINHGHILVNSKKTNIPSFLVEEGSSIEIKENSRDLPIVLESIKSSERQVPDYISINSNSLEGSFIRIPNLAEIPYPVQMQPNLVIEFYSR
jgi:small subunit ribosomal protein S4